MFTCKGDSRNLLLAGDINIPSINWCTEFPEPLTADAERFVGMLLFHDLTQLVKMPTRVYGDARSMLDLFLMRNSVRVRDTQVVVLDGISDHNMVFLKIPLEHTTQSKKEKRLVPVFSRASDVGILDVLDSSFSELFFLAETILISVYDLWRFFQEP